jgi:ABC-2 type transport system ATP-binding protein
VLSSSGDVTRAIAALAAFAQGEAHVEDGGRQVVIPVRHVGGVIPQAVRQLDAAHIDVEDVGVRHSTLDDVFFALTGHAVSEDDARDERDDEVERSA